MSFSFGEHLRALLKERRLSIRGLARAIEAPPKTVQEWVANARLPRKADHLKRLAEILGVSVHFLLFGEEDPKSHLGLLLHKTEIHSGTYEITIRKLSSGGRSLAEDGK